MPYVACTGCGLKTYAPPPYILSPDCPVCGNVLLDPGATGQARLQPSLPQRPAPTQHDDWRKRADHGA
ncbi:MAG TPA: hypothetical protein VKA47_14420 [Solirubrobacterales bacterium]|nr:hypothetical protein [Solirubrobacterales bacterium]